MADRIQDDKKQNNSAQYIKMTQTPIPKLLITLSIPSVISMLISNIYNLVDTAFVGRLGTSASGAVGIVFSFMAILQAIGFLFGQGAGSLMSRKLGAQDIEGASRYASTGFFSAFFLAALTALVCFPNLDAIVMALGSTPTIAPYAKSYITYILIAAPFLVTSFTMNNILRYEGKATFGTIGMMTGAILNMVGDPILIFGFKMGIAGAGLSTAIAQIVGFSVLLSMFIRGKSEVKLSIRYVTLKPSFWTNIVATGFPSLLRQALNSVTTVMLNTEAAFYGDAAVAAMSIVSRIIFFVFSIAVGVGQGFQPISAYNYGAKKYNRVKEGFWTTAGISEILVVCISVPVFLTSALLIGLFRDDPAVIVIGERALRLQVLANLTLPICMATEMLLQSTGKKLMASILSFSRNGFFFIICLMVLSRLRGLAGIQEAQPAAILLNVPVALFFMKRFFGSLPKGESAGAEEAAEAADAAKAEDMAKAEDAE